MDNPTTYVGTGQSLIVDLVSSQSVEGIRTYLTPEIVRKLWQSLDASDLEELLTGQLFERVQISAARIFKIRDLVEAGMATEADQKLATKNLIDVYQYPLERMTASLQAISVLEQFLNDPKAAREFSMAGAADFYASLQRAFNEGRAKALKFMRANARKALPEILGGRDSRYAEWDGANLEFMRAQAMRAVERAEAALDPTNLVGAALKLKVAVRTSIDLENLKDDPDPKRLTELRATLRETDEVFKTLIAGRRESIKRLRKGLDDPRSSEPFFFAHMIVQAGIEEAGAVRENALKAEHFDRLVDNLGVVQEIDPVTGAKVVNEEIAALFKVLKLKNEIQLVRSHLADLKAAVSDVQGNRGLPHLRETLDRAPLPLTTKLLESTGVFALASGKPQAEALLREIAAKFDKLVR